MTMDSHKKQVLLIPGYLHGDKDLAFWQRGLAESGNEPFLSGIKKSIWYSEVELKVLQRTLDRITAESGKKVTIIGHSRGGALGKVLADRNPSKVEKVITVAAPLNVVPGARDLSQASTSSYVLRTMLPIYALNILRYGIHFDWEAKFMKELSEKSKVPLISIYSKSDAEVSPDSFVREDATPMEVDCMHNDMLVSREIVDALATVLRR